MTIITPKAILSYPHLFEPRPSTPGGEPVYSCSLVFEPGTDLSAMKQEALRVAREKWADKTDAMLRTGKIRMPFREDGEEKGYPPGAVFINVRSRTAPGIVDRYAGPDGKPVRINDPEAVYPGCYVRASLRAFAYDTNGNRGVSFGLCNVQKLGDGQRLDGRKKPEDEFEAEERTPSVSDILGSDDVPF